MRQSNPNFMNGIPELLLLILLADQEMYGYELVQAIRARSDDAFTFGEGVVYPVLPSLEQDGVLSARRKNVGGRSRIYYTLTPAGRQRLARLTGDWRSVAEAVRQFLQGAGHAGAI